MNTIENISNIYENLDNISKFGIMTLIYGKNLRHAI